VRDAAAAGAELVVLPEKWNLLAAGDELDAGAEPLDGPSVEAARSWARELGIHLIAGSFAERVEGAERLSNTSVHLTPTGEVAASYRKIHLFDVDVPDGPSFAESDTCKPGEGTAVIATPLGRFGLSICYDLRFGELYRRLVDEGAEILMIPSAFTLATGKDHWEPLVRARAIETQCWVIAPAQHGKHDDGGLAHTWGHAMIVDPWGIPVATAADGPGIALAEIDLDRVARIRQAIPVASHRRL
jgi:predicted amidohydrolase